MKLFFTLFLLTISTVSFSQPKLLLDSIQTSYWDETKEDWEFSRLDYLEYDANDKMIGNSFIISQGGGNYYGSRNLNIFDANRNIIETENYKTDSRNVTAWNYDGKAVYETFTFLDSTIDYTYNYNENNQYLNASFDVFNLDNQLIRSVDSTTQFFDDNGNPVNKPFGQQIYEYDSEGNLIYTLLYSYDFQNQILQVSQANSFIYNEANKLIERINYAFNTIENQLTERFRTVFIYENNLPVEEIDYNYVNNSWLEKRKIIKVYDDENMLQEEQFYEWQNFDWIKIAKMNYKYLQGAKILEIVNQEVKGSTFDNLSKSIYYYSFSGAADNEQLEITTFPNPTTDKVILFLPTTLQNGEAMIFDASGRLIKTQNLNNQIETVAMNELIKGIYFIKIQQDELSKTVRIMKQ